MNRKANNSNPSRRQVIKAGLGAAAFYSVLPVRTDADETQQAKRAIPVGLQLYSVRKDCEKDLAGTIAAVAKMGYKAVEFAGFYKHQAQAIRKMTDDNGLFCCGSHTQFDTLMPENLDKTIEFNKVLGNKYLIVPWLDPKIYNTKDAWLKVAKTFNNLAEKVKPHGMMVGYHSHNMDFTPIEGETPWDIFCANTSKDVIVQLDTGNAMDGGGDPVAYLKKYPGRAVTIHIKEFSRTNKNAMIGEGDVNWKEVLSLCETTGGTEWYIIEEEKDVYPPIVGAEMSLKNFNKLRS
jgi:sugar phosphate isomerase/epimerase